MKRSDFARLIHSAARQHIQIRVEHWFMNRRSPATAVDAAVALGFDLQVVIACCERLVSASTLIVVPRPPRKGVAPQ